MRGIPQIAILALLGLAAYAVLGRQGVASQPSGGGLPGLPNLPPGEPLPRPERKGPMNGLDSQAAANALAAARGELRSRGLTAQPLLTAIRDLRDASGQVIGVQVDLSVPPSTSSPQGWLMRYNSDLTATVSLAWFGPLR